MAPRYPAERIFIRCPNWIGDMIAATAALRCMRRNYPAAHITLVLEPYVRPVVEHAPWYDEILECDRGRGPLRDAMRLARILREPPGYDMALLLTHAFRSALLARLSGAARRVGHAREGRSWLLTDPVPWPESRAGRKLVPKVKVYASLLAYLGCEGADDQRPEVFTSPEEESEAEALLASHGREPGRALLALVPGAAYGSSKLWEPARFARVADHFAERHGMQALIISGPGETEIAGEIASRMRSRPIRFSEGEVTLGHVKAMVRRCALMVSNDTGPRHLAIAYGVPVVTLMGPTHPAVTESDYAKEVVVRVEVPCGPCYRRRCPTDHRCMRLITPERVIGAAEALLSRWGRREE